MLMNPSAIASYSIALADAVGLVIDDGAFPIDELLSSMEVVRRQRDGSWCFMIDHPIGVSLPRRV